MAKGIEVSQTNLGGTQIQDMTFSSQALSPKSVIEGDGELTTDGSGNGTGTIYHYLPYPPSHLVFFNPGNTTAQLHPGASTFTDREKSTTWGFMDNTTLRVIPNATSCAVLVAGIPNTVYKYHYFILQRPVKQ